jgi:microcystin-dependent protein
MEPYLGQIMIFGGNFNPRGWQMCNGQLMSIAQNSALFAILGTTYGGDGVTTFALPNLQSRIPLHWGTGPGLSNYQIGEVTGTENVTLTQGQMPAHTHMVRAVSATGNQSSPSNCYLASGTDAISGDTLSNYSDATPDVTMNAGELTPAGSNIPFSVIQPVLAITFIIATEGIFPSRN